MVLTEKHIINKSHSLYKEIDNLCFLSKNLYNIANYTIRQEFFKTTKLKEQGILDNAIYLNYYAINRLFIDSNNVDYTILPRKVSNHTLMALDRNWRSFFASIKDWSKNPSKYKGRPRIPKYLPKVKGRYVIEYELDSITKKELKSGIIKLSGTNIKIPFINKDNNITLKLCRIIPSANNIYTIEIVYEKQEQDLKLNKNNIIGIDLGVNNLATLTSNKCGYIPQIINGRPLKAYNQYYNKKKAKIQSETGMSWNKRMVQLNNKRREKINHYMHVASKRILRFH